MRKRFVAISALLLTAALIAAAVLGCGGNKGASVGDPVAFFNQAKGELSQASSFAMQGEIEVKMKGASGQGSLLPANINVPFEGQMQKSNGTPDAHLSFDASFITNMLGGLTGSSVPSTMDVYLVQGKMYFQNPLDGSWYYADTTSVPGLPSSITSQDYSQLLDAATDIKVVSENDSTIKYEVGIDVDKLFTGDLSQLMGTLPENQISEQELQDMLDQLKQAVSNMKMQVTVDKASKNPAEISFTVDISFEGLGDLTGGLVDVGTGANVSFDVRFSEFGQKQDIKLPAAAQNAKPIEDLMSGSLLGF